MDLTPEQIQQISQALVPIISENISNNLLSQMTQMNQGTAASTLKRVEKIVNEKFNNYQPAQQEDNQDSPALRSIQQQLNELQKQQEQAQQTLANTNRKNAVSELFSSNNAMRADVATKIFLAENEGNIVEDQGQYFINENGTYTPIAKSVKSFLQTDVGSSFLRGSQGSPDTTNTATNSTTQPPAKPRKQHTLNSLLLQVDED